MKRRKSSSKPKNRFGEQGVPVVKVRRTPGTLTKTQIKAAVAAGVRATRLLWKTQVGAAKGTWERLHPQELAGVDGNVHTLAGLVQMRYQLSRQEADRQVKAFFDGYAPAPVAATPRAATAASVPAAAQGAAA